MNNSKKMFLAAFIVSACAFVMADPLSLPTYNQIIKVTYASNEEALNSSVKVAGLLNDARVAFTTRWDDTNPAHLQKGEMLARAGYPSTFFLTYWPDSESFYGATAKRLLELGHTFGNHTVSHPHINKTTADQFFSEIVNEKIIIETKTGATVVSYVSPYGWPRDMENDRKKMYVDMLVATGHHTSQDYVGVPVKYDSNVWFATHRMWVNDRDPNQEVFDRELAKMEREFKESNGAVPCFSYGIHSWGDHDKVNAKQEEMLKGIRNHNDWWYCNANQYGAYRYQYFNGNVVKLGVNGNVATYKLTRFKSAQLGAEIPVSFIISGEPTAVRLNGCKERIIEKSSRNTWDIPPSSQDRLAAKIVCVNDLSEEEKNKNVDITLACDAEKKEAVITIKNNSSEDLKDLYCALSLPPAWVTRRETFNASVIKKGATFTKTIPLGEKSTTIALEKDVSLYLACVDFTKNAENQRLYVKTLHTEK